MLNLSICKNLRQLNNTMKYKSYTGSVEFSQEDGVFFGLILGIRSLISYEGKTAEELLQDFKESVDFYIEDCKERNEKPEVPYKGSFNVRIPQYLHEKAALIAIHNNISLNSFVEEAIREKVEKIEAE